MRSNNNRNETRGSGWPSEQSGSPEQRQRHGQQNQHNSVGDHQFMPGMDQAYRNNYMIPNQNANNHSANVRFNPVQQNSSIQQPAHTQGTSAIETFFTDDFQLQVPMPRDTQALSREIRFNMSYLASHKLNQSAKWLGELLVAVRKPVQDYEELDTSSQIIKNQIELSESLEKNDMSEPYSFNKVFFEQPSTSLDQLNLARVLFDNREYNKCAYILKPYSCPNLNKSQSLNNRASSQTKSMPAQFFTTNTAQSCLFLRNYALFLLCEQLREEEALESGSASAMYAGSDNQGAQNPCLSVNKKLSEIEQELDEFSKQTELNAINLYLLAMVFKEQNRKSEARETFAKSLVKQPLLWSAWLELGSLLDQSERQVLENQLSHTHWAKNFYYASFYLDIQQERDSIALSGAIMRSFPDSVYLKNQIAHGSYASQEYDIAIDFFKMLLKIDPYRFENLDLYSNILYIKENYGDLANLAYNVFQNDKYRPESCCTIGNYYSLRGDHHKAVIYFQRAIKLDKKYLSAWTLMGHEYLEMKNTNAAIECYRTAVDIDGKDFRAWYGLGQAYELNNLHSYAIHYYANAALSKPFDSRMWAAMAQCYDKMGKNAEAIKCTERVEKVKDKESIALGKLARLYEQMGDKKKAAICYEENLTRRDNEGVESSETIEAYLYLARYNMEIGELKKAEEYAKPLEDYSGTEREEANRIIREINQLTQFQSGQRGGGMQRASSQQYPQID